MSRPDLLEDFEDEDREPLFGAPRANSKRYRRFKYPQAPRSRTEKVLMGAVIVLVGLSLFFGGLWAAAIDRNHAGDTSRESTRPIEVNRNVCLEPHCVLTAARVLAGLNTQVDPCEDFYQFSCGGWIEKHVLPEHKARIGTFDDLNEDNLVILRKIFESPYQPDESLSKDEQEEDKAVFTKIQTLYNQCSNTSAIDSARELPLRDLWAYFKSNFPLGGDDHAAKLARAVAYAQNIGINALFGMGVSADQKDTDKNIVYIGQGGLGLPSKEYYTDEKVTTAYQTAIIDTLSTLNFYNVTERKSIAESVVKFESELAKISLPSSELQDPSATYNPTPVKDLKQLSLGLDWDEYFSKRFPKVRFGEIVNDDTAVILEVPVFIGNLTTVLQSTPTETLEHYLHWRIIQHFGNFLSEDLKGPLKTLKRVLTGTTVEPPRWQTCLSYVNRWVGREAGRWFILKAFGGNAKEAAEEMINNVKNAFIERLPHLDWIDEKTSEYAVLKAKSLDRNIGYPDYVLKPSQLNKRLEDFITGDDFFTTATFAYEFAETRNLKEIKKKVDRKEWDMNPQEVNAYYNPPMNIIVFPAGILQGSFYDAKAPEFLNYGAIGAVVGHELTHAFDNNGRQYDAEGKLRDWWTPETSKQFDKRAQCFIDQYENYTVSGPNGEVVHLNGKLTLGENLADNGGVARALDSFRKSLSSPEGSKKSFALPGLQNYSYEQLFWVSFAQVWCSAIRPEVVLQRVRTDPHSPPQYRVAGTVSNSEEFAKAFKCPKSAPMNPERKCVIW